MALPTAKHLHNDAFASALAEASELFNTGRKNNDFGGREGACRALLAVNAYLKRIRPDCYDHLYPLLVLAAELADLHCTGVVGPMLKKPDTARGRPHAPVEQGE